MNDFVEFSKNLALLEIATLIKYPCSRDKNGKKITGVLYKNAFEKVLEEKDPFETINWQDTPYSSFSILKYNPPKQLIERYGELEFNNSVLPITTWDEFIDSFRQIRNNLVHGAKFLHGMNLEERDNELISAGLAFISFLESKNIISLQ
jgi:hypothetical protein